jgi:hypothetical protein
MTKLSLFPGLNPEPSAVIRDFAFTTPLGKILSELAVSGRVLNASEAAWTGHLPKEGVTRRWTTAEAVIESVVCRPALIPEYRADLIDCWAVLFRVEALSPVQSVQLRCGWQDGFNWQDGGPDSGECLAAQTWWNESTTVSLGSEGGDALLRRAEAGDWMPERFREYETEFNELPFCDYTERGLSIALPSLRTGERVQAHFVVAWAATVKDSVATWLGVDLDARHILRGAAGEMIWTNDPITGQS